MARDKQHALGFVMTLSASTVYNALILSLFEVTFDMVIRARTLWWVLMMQVSMHVVASAVLVVVLFVSREWRKIPREAAAFKHGQAAYVATLVGITVGWQAATLGPGWLVSRVLSLFANMAGMLALPLLPVFAVAMCGDRMTGIKVLAMLMAVWGFLSYMYQHYLDEGHAAEWKRRSAADCCMSVTRMRSHAQQAVVPAPNFDV